MSYFNFNNIKITGVTCAVPKNKILQSKRPPILFAFMVQLHISVPRLIKCIFRFFYLFCRRFRNIPLNDLPLCRNPETGLLPLYFLLILHIQPLNFFFLCQQSPICIIVLLLFLFMALFDFRIQLRITFVLRFQLSYC